MIRNETIEQAINNLELQETFNIDVIVKKWGLVKSTLRCRYKGETVSSTEAQYRLNMLLTNNQEEVLIEYINKLSVCNMHPTLQMIENLVREITRRPIGEWWMECF